MKILTGKNFDHQERCAHMRWKFEGTRRDQFRKPSIPAVASADAAHDFGKKKIRRFLLLFGLMAMTCKDGFWLSIEGEHCMRRKIFLNVNGLRKKHRD